MSKGADVPSCDKKWREMYKGNVENIQKGSDFMHLVPPTYLYPVKYTLAGEMTYRDQQIRYYEHINDQYPPFFCRPLPPTMPINIEGDARGKEVTLKLWNSISGDCILVMHLAKTMRWTIASVEKEAKMLLSKADRYTQNVSMKWIHSGTTTLLRGNAVLWSPAWKSPKIKTRLGIKTKVDQLKITHYWSRAKLAGGDAE